MEYSGSDFYCDVALAGAANLLMEYESDAVLAFHHTKPHWPHHIVVVPKRHIDSLTTVKENDRAIMEEVFVVVQDLAKKMQDKTGAARIMTNLGNYQDSKHLHFHIASGEPLV